MSLTSPKSNTIANAAHEATAALSALRAQAEPGTPTQHYSDESDRLRLWLGEHHVKSGRLDYKLREASRLHDRVLSLLTRLSNVANAPPPEGDFKARARDDAEPTALPGRVTSHDDLLPEPSEPAYSDSLSLNTDITLQDSEYYSQLTQVHDIIDFLFELGPVLLDPTPSDRFEHPVYPAAAQQDLRIDISHVRTAFPNAKENLVYRLGRANWDRRRSLASMRAILDAKPADTLLPEYTIQTNAQGDMPDSSDSDGGNGSDDQHWLHPHSNDVVNHSPGADDMSRSLSLSASRTPYATKDPSEVGLSARSTQLTEPSEFSKENLEAAEHVRATYKLPPPPHPNHSLTGEEFICCFCAHAISGMQTMREWRKHVFEDLQPYMCTHADCILSAKTYGRKKLWWTHETERHRSRQSWLCPPCKQEGLSVLFDSSPSLEAHFRDRHNIRLEPIQMRSLLDTCQRDSESEPPSRLCPLCMKDIKPNSSPTAKDVKNHVAAHLEQLALFVAPPDWHHRLAEDAMKFQQDGTDAADGPEDARAGSRASRAANSRLSASTIQLNEMRPANADVSMSVGIPPRNEHFYCRQSLLTVINGALRSPGSICYVHGIGGVGKTICAIEYCYQHQQDHDALFWLQADTAPGLVDSYFRMATALGIVENSADHDNFIGRARDWLETTNRRWLLVFDNVMEWKHIARYMPNDLARTKGSVLILTQNTSLPLSALNVFKLRVEPLSQDDGAEMLLQYLGKDPQLDAEKKLAREISVLCGGFPVAIAQAAGYVEYQQCDLRELFDTFKEWRKRTGMATDEADDLPPAFREASFKYEDMLEMVWDITLRELSEDARNVLNILAFLNSAAVPKKMLWRVHEDPSLQHLLDSREKRRMTRIHTSLTQRRLIFEADENYAMHRSLARGIRANLALDMIKQQTVFDQTVALIRETFPHADEHQQPRPDKWSEYQKLLPHLHALQQVYNGSNPRIRGSTDFIQLLMDAGLDQYERMLHDEGLTLLSTAEMALDASLDALSEVYQTMKAALHTLIALMYDDAGIGKRQEALDRRKEALKLRRNNFRASATCMSNDEVLLFNSEMDYVVSLLSYHRYEEAEPIMKKCLAKYQEWGSEEEIPFEYAKYHHNMAFIRMHQGNFEDAIHLAERGISLMGQRGFDITASRFRFDMACIIIQSGDLKRALVVHQDIYHQWVQSLGQSNQLCLYATYSIGAVNELMGNLAEAEKWFRATLSVRRTTTSWPEEAYARTNFHLARVLVAQGNAKANEAANLHEQAMEVLQRLLPPSERPPELADVTDDAILFDHMLPTGPRFTGRGLVERFRGSGA